MRLKEFGFRNIASYGNKLQMFEIEDDPELILIIGDNGAGKTTISDAITFANYGKLRKRKISGFANRTNKNAETYSKFVTEDNRLVETHRGLKPDYFKIQVDNSDIIMDKKEIKIMLENELIGIPFEVFSNTLLLSINDFESFANMNKENKRKIVDRIFGIDIFNVMKKELNSSRREPQEEYIRLDNECSTRKNLLDKHLLNVDQVKVDAEQNKQEDLTVIRKNIENIQKEIDTVTPVVQKLGISSSSLNSQIIALEATIRDDLLPKATKLESDLANIENLTKSELNRRQNEFLNEDARLVSEMQKKESDEYEREAKQNRNAIDEIEKETRLKLSEYSTQETQEHLKIDEEFKLKLKQKESKIEELKVLLGKKYKTIMDKKVAASKQRDIHYESMVNLKNNINNIQAKLDLYKLGKCPECGTDFSSGDHAHKNADYVKELELLNKKYSKAESDWKSADSQIDIIDKELEKHNKDTIVLTEKEHSIKIELGNEKQAKKDDVSNKLHEEYQRFAEVQQAKISLIKQALDQLKEKITNKYKPEYDKIHADYESRVLTASNELNKEKDERVSKINEELNKIRGEVTVKQNEVNKIAVQYSSEISELNSKNNRLIVLNTERVGEENKIKEIESKDMSKVLKNLNKQTDDLTKEYEQALDKRDAADYKLDLYKIVDKMIGDDGLKKDFMRRFIPILNQNIHEVYSKLNFKYSFYFDDDFNPIITDDNEEIGLDSLSAGESKEIDIMAVLAFIPLVKMRNPYTNVLFLDEIFYSLDKKNTALVTKLLKDFSVKYDMTIFVISHMEVPYEYFDKIYEPVFDGKFSDITQLK